MTPPRLMVHRIQQCCPEQAAPYIGAFGAGWQSVPIAPKTIVTPSARDLGVAHEVFVETDLAPAPTKPGTAAVY